MFICKITFYSNQTYRNRKNHPTEKRSSLFHTQTPIDSRSESLLAMYRCTVPHCRGIGRRHTVPFETPAIQLKKRRRLPWRQQVSFSCGDGMGTAAAESFRNQLLYIFIISVYKIITICKIKQIIHLSFYI